MWGFPCRLAQTHIPTKTYELCEDFLADLLTTTRAAKKFQAYIPTKNLWAMWRLRCILADNSKSCKDISNLHTYKNLWAMWGFPCSDNATDQSYLGLFTLRVTPKVLKCIYVLHVFTKVVYNVPLVKSEISHWSTWHILVRLLSLQLY